MQKIQIKFEPATTLLLALACLATANLILHPLSIGPEIASILQGSLEIAHGKVPGKDFYVNSSPLLLYLLLPLAVVAKLTTVNIIIVYKTLITALTVSTAYVTARHCLPVAFVMLASLCFNYSECGQLPLTCAVLFTPYLVGVRCLWWSAALASLAHPLSLAFFVAWQIGEFLSSGVRPGKQALFVIAVNVAAYLVIDRLHQFANFSNILFIDALYFKYFNEYLYWVEKSPDLRNLVYAALACLVLSSVGWRNTRVRSLVIAASIAFGLYVASVSLMSLYGMPWLYFSLAAALVALSRFTRRLPAPVLPLPLAGCLALVFTVLVSFVSARGKPPDFDYSVFRDCIAEHSSPGGQVLVYSWQARPAYPLLLQLSRRPGHFLYFYPFLIFKNGAPLDEEPVRHRLSAMEKGAWQYIESELSGDAELILIDDADIKQRFTQFGLIEKIEKRYDLATGLSLTNSDETEHHPDFEYLGYRTTFTVYKLRKQSGNL